MSLEAKRRVTIVHVRAHASDAGNETADYLAKFAADSATAVTDADALDRARREYARLAAQDPDRAAAAARTARDPHGPDLPASPDAATTTQHVNQPHQVAVISLDTG